MALIKCEECGKQVSNRAASCPNCGNPFYDNEDQVTTIQLQKKKWKLQKLLAVSFLIVGWILMMKGLFGGSHEMGGFGGFLLFVGFIWAIVAKLGSWWSTG